MWDWSDYAAARLWTCANWALTVSWPAVKRGPPGSSLTLSGSGSTGQPCVLPNQCCGSGIRCLFDPGIRKSFFRIPDLGYRIRNPYFWELSDDKFLGKNLYNSLKIGPNFFFSTSKLNNFQFWEICGYIKKVWQQFFFTPLFCCCFWIRDLRWVKIRIRDPGYLSRIRNTLTVSGSAVFFPGKMSLSTCCCRLAWS